MKGKKKLAILLTVPLLIAICAFTASMGDPGEDKNDLYLATGRYELSAGGRPLIAEPEPAIAPTPVNTPLAPGYCISNGGSTSYEYISGINYTNNPSGTMIITTNIFIANPTGCTYGDPCPEYDDSPEYVNAWIDWDGDTIFESHERVIDVNLTGYHDLNYFGTMTTSVIVTIPAGAVNTTWMRVNLGWAHDPNDPCESGWTWGDVFDEQVSTETEFPQILDIAVSGPPSDSSNPMTTQSVTLDAILSTVPGYTITNVSWSGDGIPAGATGDPYTYTPAAGTHGVKNVQCVISYEKTVTSEIGQDMMTKGFKLFFEKSGDEDGDGEPNWFEHWETDGAVPDLGSANYNAGLSAYGQWTGSQVELGPSAAGQHYSSAIVLNTYFGTESFGGPAVKGIDCASEVITHETYHAWVDDQWDTGGIFHGQTDSDRDWKASEPCGAYTCYYRDELPDFYESGTSHTWNNHSDTYDLEHEKSGVYRYYGDQEYMCLREANGSRGIPGKDWANPGKQSTPPYGAPLGLALSTAAGPVNATFTGNISDEGRDTDSDILYDYLRVSSELNVVNGGFFTIVAWLSDPAGDDITFINEQLTLDTGVHTITLDFDGLAIREHGVSGPFNVSMSLIDDDDEGNELDQQNYTTAEYDYEDFQELHAEFYDKYYEYAVDTDDDELYNYLNVTVYMLVRTTGEYTVSGWLYDSGGNEILEAQTTSYLDKGDEEVTLSFAGTAIRQHRVNGPYSLKYLTLYNAADDEIGFIYDAYTTQAYNYQLFQTKGAEFTGVYKSYGKDTNMNEYYDFLTTEVGVRVFTSGYYTLAGWLYDKNGNCLGQARGEHYVPGGLQSVLESTYVTLDFSGKPIYTNGTDGPYYLKYVTLYDETGAITDEQEDAHETSAYMYERFQPLVLLTDYYTDSGEDTDKDGSYDYLTLCAEVLTSDPGYCVLSGRLMDPSGAEILWAQRSAYFEGNVPQELCLNFSGPSIYATFMNGSLVLKDLYIYHTGDANVPDYVAEAYTTDEYSYTEFEKSASITGNVTNSLGDPIVGALVAIEGVDYDYTDTTGHYQLTIVEKGTYTVTVEPPMCSGVLGDSKDISIDLGQKIVHDFTLPSAAQLPDLVIISKVETWVREEGKYTVSYVVQNQGAVTAPKGHYTTLYIDAEPREHKLVPVELGPCEKYHDTFDKSYPCSLPSYEVRVCADNYENVTEANEKNNCVTNIWTCEVEEEKPDLEIEEKGESWVDQENGTYVVYYIVHNNGTATAPAGHYTTLYVDGNAVEHKLVPDRLQPCQTYEDKFDTVVQATPPDDRVWVCADNYNTIDELDEGDNCVRNTYIVEYPIEVGFDTGMPDNPYPSIRGTHTGTLTPNQTITVHTLYTYPCPGTGGHTEYIELYDGVTLVANGSWEGYPGDWQTITFDAPFTLYNGITYDYTIITGSYPQLHHTDELEFASGTGTITCTLFTDANGNTHTGWIPAIKLE